MGEANCKDNIISRVYHQENAIGSRVDTFKRAAAVNGEISMKDVAKWYEANIENKKRLTEYNSWVAHRAHEEYQVDLRFLKHPYNT